MKMIERGDIEKAVEILRRAQKILLVSHAVPDGDSIGVLLGLGLGLEAKGQEVIMAMPEEVPALYRFLPGWEKIKKCTEIESIPDTVVFLDCTDTERAGNELVQRLKENPPFFLVNIDHHVSNQRFGQINLVEEKAAATAEIVYELLQSLNVEINSSIAVALYTAIATDTGSFRYSNTTPHTHRLAAELLERGADLNLVRKHLYEMRPLESLYMTREALKTLQTTADGRIAWMVLTQEVLAQAQSADYYGYLEGLINYPRSIKGVEIAIFFREIEPGIVKVGFRSKEDNVDVNLLASQFGGGGHQKASGCTVNGEINAVVEEIVSKAHAFLLASTGSGKGGKKEVL